MVARMLFRFCLLAAALISPGCSHDNPVQESKAKDSPSDDTLSLPVKATIDMGVITQGESTRIRQWIQNRTASDLQVVKVDKSCDCLDVHMSKVRLAPGERALAQFIYDGKKDPEFVGSLRIEVRM